MMTLKVKDKEYKVKFGYNSFCDTDLMDRTNDLLEALNVSEVNNDKDVNNMGKIKDLFSCVRDLLFVGFKKHNPVETVQEVGEILDDYHEESTEEEPHGILDIFVALSKELMEEGFLGGLMKEMATEEEIIPKTPQDHKKTQKK